MDAVNRIGCNIYRTLEAKCHICPPQIIVDRLGKRYHIKPFLPEQIRRLVTAVPSQHNKTIQLQSLIGSLH